MVNKTVRIHMICKCAHTYSKSKSARSCVFPHASERDFLSATHCTLSAYWWHGSVQQCQKPQILLHISRWLEAFMDLPQHKCSRKSPVKTIDCWEAAWPVTDDLSFLATVTYSKIIQLFFFFSAAYAHICQLDTVQRVLLCANVSFSLTHTL